MKNFIQWKTNIFIFFKFIPKFRILAEAIGHFYALYILKVVNFAIEAEMSVQTIPHSSIKGMSRVEQELWN